MIQNVAEMCLDIWGKENHPKAKFKHGDKVIWKNKECTILAMNYCEDDEKGNPVFEYVIDKHIYLVWESELKAIE